MIIVILAIIILILIIFLIILIDRKKDKDFDRMINEYLRIQNEIRLQKYLFIILDKVEKGKPVMEEDIVLFLIQADLTKEQEKKFREIIEKLNNINKNGKKRKNN